MDDLCLHDPDNPKQVVIDPSTGQPAYNPLNIWNSGTVSTETQGGAMHLTSTPNTIQTETGLAAAATVQRTMGNNNSAELICCAQYGQPYRNSDPNIGQNVNKLVSLGSTVTLTNPPGLYIQMPSFGSYRTPDGSDPSRYWTIVRGTETLNGEDGKPLPHNFILHARYEVPQDKNFTVSDITIDGKPIQWAGQIAKTFLMEINGTGFANPVPAALPCVGTAKLAQPLQLFWADLLDAYRGTSVPNPITRPKTVAMNLASNTTLIAPKIKAGAKGAMVLTMAGFALGPSGELPSVTVDDPDITAVVTGVSDIFYAVPGNTDPAHLKALAITVEVQIPGVGLKGLSVTNYGQKQPGPVMPALLNVV